MIRIFSLSQEIKNLQFIIYAGVSATSLIADFMALIFFKEYLGLNYIGSTAIGLLIGSAVHYSLAKIVVFREGRLRSKLAEFIFYAALGGIAMLLSLGVVILTTEVFRVDYRLAKVPAVVVSFITGFILRKNLLFEGGRVLAPGITAADETNTSYRLVSRLQS